MGTVLRSIRAAELVAPEGVRLPVLVVENHADCASSLADLLEFCGYTVTIASTGREALALADPPPCIVITELRLPDLDGYDLVRQLRERSAARPLLIVAVTSRQRDEDHRLAAAAGVDVHLSKPADPKVLLAALARFSRTLVPGSY